MLHLSVDLRFVKVNLQVQGNELLLHLSDVSVGERVNWIHHNIIMGLCFIDVGMIRFV